MAVKRNVIFLAAVVATLTLNMVGSTRAFVIESIPILSIESKTDELPIDGKDFYTDTIDGIFRIGQIQWEDQRYVWLWYEDHNVKVPSGESKSFPILLQHEIITWTIHPLVFSFQADVIEDSTGEYEARAYGYEEGVTPPEDEPPSAPLIVLPLANPRPTSINFNIYAYASPPTLVGRGTVSWSYPVGGKVVPVNKYELLKTWIGLLAIISLIIVFVSRRAKNI